MTDKNTAALAAHHPEDHLDMVGRWYMVTHDGAATLCVDREDAEAKARKADREWPHMGPHRAVQLVEASTASFTAADMATASAQGFRDGVASLSANAGEPFGWVKQSEIDSSKQFGGSINLWRRRYDCDVPVYLAAPPTAQAEVAKLRGQRMVLCSLLGECMPVIDALMQIPGDDDSDAHLNGLAGRITGALNALAEERVKGGES